MRNSAAPDALLRPLPRQKPPPRRPRVFRRRRPSACKSPEQIDAAIRQLVSKAITTEGEIIVVFTDAGLKKPDIGILSPQFLAEVRGLKHKNVPAELLEKLLGDDKLKVIAAELITQRSIVVESRAYTVWSMSSPSDSEA